MTERDRVRGGSLLCRAGALALLAGACGVPDDDTTFPVDVPREDAGDVETDVPVDVPTDGEDLPEIPDSVADDAGETDAVAPDDGGGGPCTSDRECSDGVDCTRDTCDLETGRCAHEPQAEPCNDGDPCTGIEYCDVVLGCRPGTPIVCDDGIDCTVDACNRLSAECEFVADHTRCTEPELCDPDRGGCAPPISCATDEDCDDGDLCNGVETCGTLLVCERGTPIVCDDGVDCTIDHCVPADGSCEAVPDDAACDDGVACTVDRCDGALGRCTHEASDALCDDGQFCNGAERCLGAAGCAAGTPPVCSDALACTIDRCDPAAAGGAGACVFEPPDVDGDTYYDLACTGDDCDDLDPRIHPGMTESCNAVDDDCDTLTDETFACVRGTPGSCTTTCGSTGSRTCSGSCSWGVCNPPAETCNGTDDDCDTSCDEGWECCAGTSATCTTWCGSSGSRSCSASCGWGACNPPAEACNGLDDDCDGSTDEGFTCAAGSGGSCTTTCGSVGSRVCSSSCTWDACSPPAETCNGTDDDCDTVCDNGFACCAGTTSSCSNACGVSGTRTCSSSCSAGPCCAASEVCGNTCDDDCDGLTNEGCGPTCTVIEGFESGVWPASGWVSVAAGGALSSAYAHDGSYGLRDPDWHYRTATTVGNAGDRLFVWTRPGTGRTYFGFGANSTGAYSIILAPNTTELLLQQNSGWGYTNLTSTPCTFSTGVWYKLEVEFVSTTSIVARVYESNGTTVRCSLSRSIAGLAPAGIALRSFNGHDSDTITLCR
ncbi:MAG: putative metal-binding motif-containing protein [Deltaproteobacteria bacterium]|nr:putative metal-binding motif-containing protein [Deltaproteobacteria bacterium]